MERIQLGNYNLGQIQRHPINNNKDGSRSPSRKCIRTNSFYDFLQRHSRDKMIERNCTLCQRHMLLGIALKVEN